MKYKQITMIFIMVFVAAAIVFDFYIIAVGGTSASISHMVIIWSHKYPMIPFMIGFLCGHFFFRMKRTKESDAIDKMIKDLD